MMKHVWAVGAALLLCSCERPGDFQPPIVGISYPKSGILSSKQLKVEGYVLDDQGIQSLTAGNRKLVSKSQVGQKLIRFSFTLKAQKSGTMDVKLVAVDTQGQKTVRRLALELDAIPPVITGVSTKIITNEITPAKIEVKEDGTEEIVTPAVTESVLQISGKVKDNTRVEKVALLVDGKFRSLSLPKNNEVSFYDEVPLGRVTIYAVDAAGHRTSQWVR